MSLQISQGSFTATGQSSWALLQGDFNITLSGTFVATVQLERSFDGGTTWRPITYIDGSQVVWVGVMSTSFTEVEAGVLYRLNCTIYTSGTAAWRLSQ